MPFLSCLLAAAVAGGTPVPAAPVDGAFPLTDDVVLRSLIAEAFGNNPELRGAEHSVAVARARLPQAAALPDPTFSLSYQNGGHGLRLGADDDTGLGLTASQAFPYPGKRRLAERVEAKDAGRAEQSAERARRSLLFQVRRSYAGLLLVRENLSLIDDQKRATNSIEELTRSRYSVGLAAQSDVLRPQAELARLDQMRLHEEGLEVSAVAEMNRLLARPAGSPVALGRPLRLLTLGEVRVPTLQEIVTCAESADPEVASARLLLERSQAALDLARRNLKPDFVASTTYLSRGSLPAMWTLQFGVSAPLWASRKQRQGVAEAEARLRVEAAALETTQLRARAAAEKSRADLAAAVREAESYSRGVLVIDGLAVESGLASYGAGKVPFVSVLEAHNTRYRDRREYAALLFHVLWHSASLDEQCASSAMTPLGGHASDGGPAHETTSATTETKPSPKEAP